MTVNYAFYDVPFNQSVTDNQIYLGVDSKQDNCFSGKGSFLIENILKNIRNIDGLFNQNEITVNMPVMPGLDIMAGAYLVKNYIETGRTPKAASRLINYLDSIEQSECALNKQSLYTLYFIMTVIGKYYDNLSAVERSAILIEKSEILFKKAMINYLLDPAYDLITAPVAQDEPQFATEIANAAKDFDSYISDRDTVCEIISAHLPMNDGSFSTQESKLIFWTRVPKCKLYEFWAALDGFALTAVILSQYSFTAPNQNIYPVTDYKISILQHPFAPQPDYCTQSIAKELEYAELALEKDCFSDTPHAKRLRGIPGAYPFCGTDNPWIFDFGHVFSPKGGSLLSVKQLQSIIGQLYDRRISQLSYSLILPFTFPYKKYSAVCSQLEKTGLTPTSPSCDIIDYSVNPQPCLFSWSILLEGINDVSFAPNVLLYIYPNGTGMAILRPDINFNSTYADFALDKLLALKESFKNITAEKLFAPHPIPIACKFSYLPSVSYIGLLLSAQGYGPTAQSCLKYYCYSLSTSDNSALYTEDILYSPDNNSKICFDQSACAGAFIAHSDNANKYYEQFNSEWSVLMLSLLQRRCTLNCISSKLNMLSPAQGQMFKNIDQALIYLGSGAVVPHSKAPEEAKEFYQTGINIYRINEITAELHNRIKDIGDFLIRRSAGMKITLMSFVFAVLILFILLFSGLVKLSPIIDTTGTVPVSLTSVFIGLGVLAGIGGITFLISYLIKQRRK